MWVLVIRRIKAEFEMTEEYTFMSNLCGTTAGENVFKVENILTLPTR